MRVAYGNEGNQSCGISHQSEVLKKEGYDLILIEKEGTNKRLTLIQELLEEEDELVVCRLECLGLPLFRLLSFLEDLKDRKIAFHSIEENIRIIDYENSSFFYYLELLVRTEKAVKSNLTIYGIQVARNKGNFGGRPPISDETIRKIRKLNSEHHYSYRKIARLCDVSLGVVHKYIRSSQSEDK